MKERGERSEEQPKVINVVGAGHRHGTVGGMEPVTRPPLGMETMFRNGGLKTTTSSLCLDAHRTFQPPTTRVYTCGYRLVTRWHGFCV